MNTARWRACRCEPVVLLANAIAAAAGGRRLQYMHAPFAAANIPPALDDGVRAAVEAGAAA